MKIAFVGGGAVRLFSILRTAMGDRRIFPDGGEIALYDLAHVRAETIGRLLMKTPEYRSGRFTITWPDRLEDALVGASMVGVVLSPGSRETAGLSDTISFDYGCIFSDNLSPAGAMFGLKGGETILQIARTMEKLCPDAWLADFANPVAVFSGMVNNHTSIKALGVCAGFTNHYWDIGRILDSDSPAADINVEVAGVNHLSFILRGTVGGNDLFKSIDQALRDGWKMPPSSGLWSDSFWKEAITPSVESLVGFYSDLGVLIFSTESDGMDHLRLDRRTAENAAKGRPPVGHALHRKIETERHEREASDLVLRSFVSSSLTEQFWEHVDLVDMRLALSADDIFLRILRGLNSSEPVQMVTSRLNEGAVDGFDRRTVLEYSQTMTNGVIEARGDLAVPAGVRGLTTALAVHQTMLGDAIATHDPKLLAHALLCYPWMAYTQKSRSMHKELIQANTPDIHPLLARAVEFL